MANVNLGAVSGALLTRKGRATPSVLETSLGTRTPRASRIPEAVNKNPLARVSCRLESEENFRLRMYSAQTQRSLQDVISDALSEYLNKMIPDTVPNCTCIGGRNRGG